METRSATVSFFRQFFLKKCVIIAMVIIMKKYIYSILLAILVGITFGKFMLSQYQNPNSIIPVISDSFKIYFIELGSYNTEVQMKEGTSGFPYYIYMLQDGKYYVYIGITKNEKNLNKIQGYYQEKGYSVNVREYKVDNEAFLTVLEQYDTLLEESDEQAIIDGVCSQVLTKYEELVLKNV